MQGAKLGRPKGERPEACKLKGKEEMILQYIKEHKTKVYISKKLGVNRQTLREFLQDSSGNSTEMEKELQKELTTQAIINVMLN